MDQFSFTTKSFPFSMTCLYEAYPKFDLDEVAESMSSRISTQEKNSLRQGWHTLRITQHLIEWKLP